MKLNCIVLVLLSSTVLIGCDHSIEKELEVSYLGQKTPGLTAEIFAPGLVSGEHRDLSAFFSPDMTKFYFTRKENESNQWSLISYKLEQGRWREDNIEPRIGRPFISPDGKIMHLGKKYKKAEGTGWSKVKSLGADYEKIRIMRLTSSLQGTYVLDEATREGTGTLRYSKVVNGKREQPKPLSKEINTGKWNAHPFIAPDESYILWDGERESGFGGNDIYVSFKQDDGSWGKAVNLGNKVNTEAEDTGAYVTPDGKYLFFNSDNGEGNRDIFWIDAEVIERVRPS